MTDSPPSSVYSRLHTAVLSVPLRFKITIPYLVIAMILAGLATWMVSQSFAKALQERFRGQLVDSAAAANDDLFQIERDQLAGVRAIARTEGMAAAVAGHDWEALDKIVRPLAVNSRLSLVHILDDQGRPVYGLRAAPGGYSFNENADFASWEPVSKVLRGDHDDLGDKYVGLADTPWGATVYTAGPIRDGERLIGVVLVGTPLAEMLAAMRVGVEASITLYRPDGQMALTSFGGAGPAALERATIQEVSEAGLNRLISRSATVGAEPYNEALGSLVLRGQPTGWFIGIALAKSAIGDQLSPAQIGLWFTAGVLAVIGLGVVVAQIVAVPISELVRASSQVAAGDLSIQVQERSRDELGQLAQRFNWMVRELKQREMMRELFGQVVSEQVREALLGGKVGLGGEMKVVTVLFTDIRDFTSLAETYDPHEVVSLLNSYFEVVTDAIYKAGGFINKFGGDSTMAVFGAPINAPPKESAQWALQAAFSIRTRLAEFNARQIEKNQLPIKVGIGINTGEVVTGNIGSQSRFEYTVIGDTVNTAARIQSLTGRFTDSNILITEDTRLALGKDAQLLVIDHGEVALKGKMKLVRVYGVMGMRFSEAEPLFHVGGIPRRDVLEALYLYCKGFSPRTIGLTKNIDPIVVHQWVEGASRLFERASLELIQEFDLTDEEVRRLLASTRTMPEGRAVEPLLSLPDPARKGSAG